MATSVAADQPCLPRLFTESTGFLVNSLRLQLDDHGCAFLCGKNQSDSLLLQPLVVGQCEVGLGRRLRSRLAISLRGDGDDVPTASINSHNFAGGLKTCRV